MNPTQIIRGLVEEAGWQTGSSLEDRVSLQLHRWGFRPNDVVRELRLGRWRVDFAFTDIKVVLEVDGWHHRSPEGSARDAARDAELRALGWLVLRVDDREGEEGLLDQLARVAGVVRSLRAGN